ncbi:hypothetical protein AG1IA_07460 [Rhizoctonia solani AG-1 IA]|uniref:Uncharacterized protein n=1 Tax=Thanatephorus cucumeris (strain AG1-IA) TaxID=983506 RepID=L8WP16_THACA|nr:hypothetical protein AG1IA_07460 [Rhizoctonia solani AG-1 IA]
MIRSWIRVLVRAEVEELARVRVFPPWFVRLVRVLARALIVLERARVRAPAILVRDWVRARVQAHALAQSQV